MKTKTLLIAAAALAAGIMSSQAQTPVYSQNIVGYVNQTLPQGAYSLVVAPLQATGTVNNAEQVLPAVQANDNVLLWNGSGFDIYVFSGSPGLWIGPSGPGPAPTLNAGTSFFYLNSSSSNETNTYVGSVTLTNSTTLVPNYSLAGSVVPIAGSIDSTNFNLPFQANDNVLLFNGSGYDIYVYSGSPGLWIGPSGPGSAPVVNVGQSFFYLNSSGANEQWNQSFTIQ
jgi:hypothetical protein